VPGTSPLVLKAPSAPLEVVRLWLSPVHVRLGESLTPALLSCPSILFVVVRVNVRSGVRFHIQGTRPHPNVGSTRSEFDMGLFSASSSFPAGVDAGGPFAFLWGYSRRGDQGRLQKTRRRREWTSAVLCINQNSGREVTLFI
jgi:hypothetical protein